MVHVLSSPASEILYHESALRAAHRNGNEISPKVPALHFPMEIYSALSLQVQKVGLECAEHLCDHILNFSFKFIARRKSESRSTKRGLNIVGVA